MNKSEGQKVKKSKGQKSKKETKEKKTTKKKASQKEEDFKVNLEELLEAGCHFGHQSRRWNPNMKKYIWKEREGIHIFDLLKTRKKLTEACKAAKELVKEGKKILFVGTKRQARDVIREEVQKVDMPWVAVRWVGGTLTNWKQIKKSIDKLKKMKEEKEAGEYEMYTKKENILIDREIRRLKYLFGGIKDLEKPPEAIFIVDTKREDTAVREAKLEGLTTFAIVDSNADPTEIDHLIPANDDAIRSIKLIVSEVVSAIAEGEKIRSKVEGQRSKVKKSKGQKGGKKNG